MTIISRFEEVLIRIFINPHFEDETIDFKSRFKKAKRILISYPPGREFEDCRPMLDVFTKLFPKQNLTILHFDVKKYNPQRAHIHRQLYPYLTLPDIPRQSLMSFAKSKSLKTLRQLTFDILFDLDPNFNLLNAYLCRMLKPPIRVGFKKACSSSYYNIEYNVETDSSYSSKLQGLINMLQSMIS
jgi:hypothetical protein